MHDVSLEDNEEEEEAQHDVAQVAQDVVEGAARDRGSQGSQGSLSFSPLHLMSRARPGVGGRRVNLPEGSQRVGAQEVVEADVLVSSDVDHLEQRFYIKGRGASLNSFFTEEVVL